MVMRGSKTHNGRLATFHRKVNRMFVRPTLFAVVGCAFVAVMIAGCTVPDTFAGSVVAVTDRTVTVRGTYAMNGAPAQPTPAMVAQAQAICPAAQYLSATPTAGNLDMFDYLFMCE